MIYSLDSGGSTLDIVKWIGKKPKLIESIELNSNNFNGSIVNKYCKNASQLIITGGKTKKFTGSVSPSKIIKINEIDAIGYGGYDSKIFDNEEVLVVSMGTGTCMVGVSCSGRRSAPTTKEFLEVEHIGGTGIGGGTFLALCKTMLGITDLDEILKLFGSGSLSKVDLSVKEIIGQNLGKIPETKTAANLGKIVRTENYTKEDLAKGIINMIAQSIGMCGVMAAKSYKTERIVLVGKLTKIKPICSLIKEVANLYDMEVHIPKYATWAMARGAGLYYMINSKI